MIQVPLDDEQETFRRVVAQMITERSGRDRHPEGIYDVLPGDRALWMKWLQGGYVDAVVPPSDTRLLGLMAEQVGRFLVPVPLASVVLAAQLVRDVETDNSDIEKVSSGELWTAVCATGPKSSLTINTDDGEMRLSGTFEYVLGANEAERFLVVDTAEAGNVWKVDAAYVRVRPEHFDLTRDVGMVDIQDAPAELLKSGNFRTAYGKAEKMALLVDTCELAGVAQSSLQMAVEHSTSRYQFGRPIGSFQALQHAMARAALDNEAALAAARRACRAASTGSSDVDTSIYAAAMVAKQAAERSARLSLQIYGGMGFTWENRAHLYLRRAKAGQTRFRSVLSISESISQQILEST